MAEGEDQLSRDVKSLQLRSFTSVKRDKLAFIKNLGQGGFGIVTLQRHMVWGKVAVKQVIEKKVTQETKKAFYREARKMLDVITSQYVVSVMGMVEAPDGGISIIMEYMEYGNLRHFTPLYLVTKETAPNSGDNNVFRSDCWPRRMLMICEVIKGMNFLHTLPEPIYHRDLKLDNVFVGAGFRVKIGDLGLAVSRVSKSAQCNRGTPGTISHQPPEILNGDVSTMAIKAWDGYGFGISLFEFVTLTPVNGRNIPWPEFATDLHIWNWVTSKNKRPDMNLILADTPDVVVDTMKECWDADFTKRPSFQDLQQRFIKLYEEKYESSIRSADTKIMINLSTHEQEEAMRVSEPTGLTQNSSPSTSPGAIHDIHSEPSERKTKMPIQNVSIAGSSTTTHPPIMEQNHARPPPASGCQSSSNEDPAAPSGGPEVTQPTGYSIQPSQTAAAASTPEGPVPASASCSPGGETVSPDRSISPLNSMPQDAATGSGRVSAEKDQGMQQRSLDLPGPRSPDDPPIPPPTSTVPSYAGGQRWQQSDEQRTYGEGTTRFSSSTNMPQQATPSNVSQDDYDIPLVPLPNNGQFTPMTSYQTVETEQLDGPAPTGSAPAGSSPAGKQIMISYMWDENRKRRLRTLKVKLEEQGHDVWMDETNMASQAGEGLHDRLAAAINDCDVFLMCLSEGYETSPFCTKEAKYAEAEKKTIIPLKDGRVQLKAGWLKFLLHDRVYYPIGSDEALEASFPNIMEEITKEQYPRTDQLDGPAPTSSAPAGPQIITSPNDNGNLFDPRNTRPLSPHIAVPQKALSTLASNLGSYWEQLAIHMGLNANRAYHWKQASPYSLWGQVFAMLTEWRATESRNGNGTIQQLIDNLLSFPNETIDLSVYRHLFFVKRE